MAKEHLSIAKEQYLLEAQKAYIAMNGAGAATLLAFLQAIWPMQDAQFLRKWILFGIIAFAIGAAIGAASYSIRHFAYVENKSDKSFLVYRVAYRYIPFTAIACFLLGLLLPVTGAFLGK